MIWCVAHHLRTRCVWRTVGEAGSAAPPRCPWAALSETAAGVPQPSELARAAVRTGIDAVLGGGGGGGEGAGAQTVLADIARAAGGRMGSFGAQECSKLLWAMEKANVHDEARPLAPHRPAPRLPSPRSE